MTRLPFAACLCLWLACATAGPAPGATAREDGEDAPVEASTIPNESKELADAWAPESPAPTRRVVALPPPRPVADRAEGLNAALARAEAALKARDLATARAAAEAAVTEAQRLNGDARQRAGRQAWAVEVAAEDPKAAQAAALAWHDACGPEHLDACRAAAVASLTQLKALKGASPQLVQLARTLTEADACAHKAERGGHPPACLGAALKTAQSRKDLLLQQRIALEQALDERDEKRQLALLEKAEGRCALPQCVGLRRKALGKLIQHAKARGDAEGLVRLALRDQEVLATTLDEAARVYARTREVDQACQAWEATAGPGACRALEKKVTGRLSFRDYSKDSAGQGLSAEQVRTVNEHFAPTLAECLAEQARRMTPPDAQRFEVRWVVVNDGRVAEVHLRKDLDDIPLAHCLRKQFPVWRYPRYEGEYQNVEQSFTVTATERRALR